MVGILPSLILYMFAKRPVQPVKLVRKACLKGQGAHSSMPSQPVPDFLAPSGFYPNYFRPHILGTVKGLGCFHLHFSSPTHRCTPQVLQVDMLPFGGNEGFDSLVAHVSGQGLNSLLSTTPP